jgi:hypothetical protein
LETTSGASTKALASSPAQLSIHSKVSSSPTVQPAATTISRRCECDDPGLVRGLPVRAVLPGEADPE